MKIVKYAFTLLIVIILASCSMTRPYAVTNNPIGTKVGTSENTCIFRLTAYGNVSASGLCFKNNDYGIYQAAKKAGINKVGAVDLKITRKILYTQYTLIVYGE
jgi:hypothetical protein